MIIWFFLSSFCSKSLLSWGFAGFRGIVVYTQWMPPYSSSRIFNIYRAMIAVETMTVWPLSSNFSSKSIIFWGLVWLRGGILKPQHRLCSGPRLRKWAMSIDPVLLSSWWLSGIFRTFLVPRSLYIGASLVYATSFPTLSANYVPVPQFAMTQYLLFYDHRRGGRYLILFEQLWYRKSDVSRLRSVPPRSHLHSLACRTPAVDSRFGNQPSPKASVWETDSCRYELCLVLLWGRVGSFWVPPGAHSCKFPSRFAKGIYAKKLMTLGPRHASGDMYTSHKNREVAPSRLACGRRQLRSIQNRKSARRTQLLLETNNLKHTVCSKWSA